jgi:hypothetical protein
MFKPSSKQLPHLFRKSHGTVEGFVNAARAVLESLSIQMLNHPLLAAASITRIMAISSACKIEENGMRDAKPPIKFAKWSLNTPPHAARLFTRDPSVLAFFQRIVGAFHRTRVVFGTFIERNGI